jgi:hypothetical protein
MSKRRKITKEHPFLVLLPYFWDERIYTPPHTWQCVNHPYFTQEFEDWLDLHTPAWKRLTYYEKVRSNGRWGNKGGWMENPTHVELIFENPGSKLLFQLHWLK